MPVKSLNGSKSNMNFVSVDTKKGKENIHTALSNGVGEYSFNWLH